MTGCSTGCLGLVDTVVVRQLDPVILKIFSKRSDSVIVFYGSLGSTPGLIPVFSYLSVVHLHSTASHDAGPVSV